MVRDWARGWERPCQRKFHSLSHNNAWQSDPRMTDKFSAFATLPLLRMSSPQVKGCGLPCRDAARGCSGVDRRVRAYPVIISIILSITIHFQAFWGSLFPCGTWYVLFTIE